MWDICLISLLLAIMVFLTWTIFRFMTSSRDDQRDKVMEWLLWAVTIAEKNYGGGTGKIKLREVYAQFVQTWPQVAAWLPFQVFSDMVDEVLRKMRAMLENNEAIKNFVEGSNENK